MARNIVRASNEYLELLSAPVTAPPFTISAWAKTDVGTTTDDYCIAQIQDRSANDSYWRLNADGADNLGEFAFGARAPGSSLRQAVSTIVPVVGKWYQVTGIEFTSGSRKVLVDGGGAGTNSEIEVPTGIDSISTGRERDNTDADSWSGDLAEVAVWNVGLTDREASILAIYSALFVRPQNLVYYTKLLRSPKDRISGSILTLNGTTVSIHPPIIYPSPPMIMTLAAAAAAAGNPWYYYAQQ